VLGEQRFEQLAKPLGIERSPIERRGHCGRAGGLWRWSLGRRPGNQVQTAQNVDDFHRLKRFRQHA
jgi:hypothetical protein